MKRAVVAAALLGCQKDVIVLSDLVAASPDASVVTPQPPGARDPNRLLTLDAGAWHTCAIVGSKTYCWGRNDHGAIGAIGQPSSATPTELATPRPFVALALGGDFGCGLDRDGALACWGRNDQGQLGLGDTRDRTAPETVPIGEPLVQVSTLDAAVCAIGRSGALYCWGYGRENGLGLGGPPGQGADELSPRRVGTDSDWTYVSTGQGHTCGIRDGGRLFCWGRNSSLACGLGPGSPAQVTTPSPVSERRDWYLVTAGTDSTCALDRSGGLYCWGTNAFGLVGVAADSVPAPTRIPGVAVATSVRTSAFDSCAQTDTGGLACWGFNEFGELGLGDRAPRRSPVTVLPGQRFRDVALGRQHVCVRRDDGAVLCAGRSWEGQVGDGTRAEAVTELRLVPLP